jgi:hypothetical protein
MERRAIYYESNRSEELLHKLSNDAVTEDKTSYFGLAYISIDSLVKPLINNNYDPFVLGLSPVRNFKLSDRVYHLVFPFYKVSEKEAQYDEIISYVCIRNYKLGEPYIFFDVLDKDWNYLVGKNLCFPVWPKDKKDLMEEVVFDNVNVSCKLRNLFKNNIYYHYQTMDYGKFEYIRVYCDKYDLKTNDIKPVTLSIPVV